MWSGDWCHRPGGCSAAAELDLEQDPIDVVPMNLAPGERSGMYQGCGLSMGREIEMLRGKGKSIGLRDCGATGDSRGKRHHCVSPAQLERLE